MEPAAPFLSVLRSRRKFLTLINGAIRSDSPRAAFIGASFTTEIWHLVLSQGVAFGIGMGFLFVGCVGVTPQWFNKKRSFANAVASSGSGFGGVCYSLATNAMIKNIGLPWAFRVLAILAFAVNGICSMLMRDRNKQVGAVHVAFNKVLFKKIEFYMYVSWGFFSLLSYTIVIFSLPDYAQTVGLSASQGSVVAACFNGNDSSSQGKRRCIGD